MGTEIEQRVIFIAPHALRAKGKRAAFHADNAPTAVLRTVFIQRHARILKPAQRISEVFHPIGRVLRQGRAFGQPKVAFVVIHAHENLGSVRFPHQKTKISIGKRAAEEGIIRHQRCGGLREKGSVGPFPLVFGISQHREAGQVEGLQGGHIRQPRGRERRIHRLLDQIAFFVLQSPQMLDPAILIKNIFHNIFFPGPGNELFRRGSPNAARLPVAGIGGLGVLRIAPVKGLIAVQQERRQFFGLVKGVGVIHGDLPLAVGILQQAQNLLAVMDKYRRSGVAPFRVGGFREVRVALPQTGGKQFGFSLCGAGAWQSEDAQQEGQQQGKAFHGGFLPFRNLGIYP